MVFIHQGKKKTKTLKIQMQVFYLQNSKIHISDIFDKHKSWRFIARQPEHEQSCKL